MSKEVSRRLAARLPKLILAVEDAPTAAAHSEAVERLKWEFASLKVFIEDAERFSKMLTILDT